MTNPPDRELEAVARIIDPYAWDYRPGELPTGRPDQRPHYREQALTKAAEILALISRREGDGWLPIETAPSRGWFDVWRDGVRFPNARRMLRGFGASTGAWNNGAPVAERMRPPPTHWRPLPEPPALQPTPPGDEK